MAASKFKIQIGLFTVAARAEKATDDESSGFHAICTGTEDQPHDPARVRTTVGCTSCDTKRSSVYGFPQRGREEGDKIVVVTAEELRGAAGEPRNKVCDLAFHRRTDFFAATVAGDSVQNLSPDKGGERAYIALRNTLLAHPELVAVTIWAPKSKNALWVLEVVDGRIVMSKRCWPEAVRQAPAIPDAEVSEMEQTMIDTLVEGLVTDFDIKHYVDESKKGVEELVAARAEGAVAAAAGPLVAAPAASDMLAALQASVDALLPKQPAKKAPAKKAAPRKRVAKKVAASAESAVA